MNVFHDTKKSLHIFGWVASDRNHNHASLTQPLKVSHPKPKFDLLDPIRQLLDNIKINNPQLGRFLCRLIPSQCPFERDIKLFGRTLFHIPPMCKFNPLYEEFIMLRFRALSYLADECGEDVSRFC